jgi:hypothetical protein
VVRNGVVLPFVSDARNGALVLSQPVPSLRQGR